MTVADREEGAEHRDSGCSVVCQRSQDSLGTPAEPTLCPMQLSPSCWDQPLFGLPSITASLVETGTDREGSHVLNKHCKIFGKGGGGQGEDRH